MALERLEAFPGCSIPHHHLAITTGANDLIALKTNSIHRTLMSLEGGKELKGISIPDTDESVFRAADDMLVVDTKIEDASTVSIEDGINLGPGSISEQIPHNDGTITTASDHETRGEWIVNIPILVKFQAEDAASVAPEGSQHFPSL
jgi:hypothetical protein